MSAPNSIGRQRNGVARVASTTKGTPWPWATAASPSRSAIAPDGLPMTSAYTARVRGVSAAAKAATSSPSTNVVSMPSRRSVTSSSVRVPP